MGAEWTANELNEPRMDMNHCEFLFDGYLIGGPPEGRTSAKTPYFVGLFLFDGYLIGNFF
jgi:hypothetical protein